MKESYEYNYVLTFTFGSPSPIAGALGQNSQTHVVTINDAIVKGFSLIGLNADIIITDTAVGPAYYNLHEYDGMIQYNCGISGTPGVFGDSSNITDVPANWLRDILKFKPHQKYSWTPGIYIPGNVVNLDFGFILDANYVIQGAVQWNVNYVIQLGFQIHPVGSTVRVYRDDTAFLEPAITDPLPG